MNHRKPSLGRVLLLALAATALAAGQAPAAAPAPVKDQPISKEDRKFAINELKRTRTLLLQALKKISPEQAKFKSAPERWSVLECAEHIARTEAFLMMFLREKVLKGPALAPAPDRITNQQMIDRITDRSKPAQAPKEIAPSGQYASMAAAAAAFKVARKETIQYTKTTQDPLRMRGSNRQDGYQYILLVAAHTERHVKQINEVKAHANYPKM